MVLLVLGSQQRSEATGNVPQPDAADFYGLAEEVMAEVTANTIPVDEEMKNMLAELAKEDVDAPSAISNLAQAPLARALQELIESHAGERNVSPPPKLATVEPHWNKSKKYEYVVDKSLVLANKPGVEYLTDLRVLNKNSKVCLCPSAGVFVSIFKRKFHLLLLHRCNRKFWVWIRDPLFEELYVAMAFLVESVEEVPKASKSSLEFTRLKVQILCFLVWLPIIFLCLGNYAMARQT